MKAIKHSHQRDAVKAYLYGRTDHPTADAVYQGLRTEYPNISLGTVYRNLNLLVDLGELRRVTCGDGRDHFDWNMNPHYHMLCRRCGAVSDLMLEHMTDIDARAQAAGGGRIEGHSISFYGICAECLRREGQ